MSIRAHIKAIEKAVSPGRLDAMVRRLANYERYPASKGYRRAAADCLEYLRKEGIDAKIHVFPADGRRYQGAFANPEWLCRSAWCELVEDGHRRIADYQANHSSVYENCGPCAPAKTVEVILLDKGTDERGYHDIDFNGKVVFAPGVYFDYRWAIAMGAVGIVSDRYIGKIGFYPNVRRWCSFPGNKTNNPLGFCLCPSEGAYLKAFIEKRRAEGQSTHLLVYADTERRDSAFEIVDAFLPGQVIDEEIMIVAHLCHPRGSANDNLSGVSGGIETLRVLKRLTETGVLPPLNRGVRLILAPELLGSYAYLEMIGDKRRKILAGLNLDMIAASQNGNSAPVVINEPPYSAPSFVTGLLSAILKELTQDARAGSKYAYAPMYNASIMEYNGGSDHSVWTDPAVFVPMPTIGQFPDRFSHTDGDLPETLDPFIHVKNTVMAAAYAYTLANLCAADARIIIGELGERLVNRIHYVANQAAQRLISPLDYSVYVNRIYLAFYKGACEDLLRFFNNGKMAEATGIADMAASAKSRLDALAKAAAASVFGVYPEPQPWQYVGGDCDLVPERSFLGMISNVSSYFENQEEYEKLMEKIPNIWTGSLFAKTEYLIDGKRTIGQIAELARYGNHQDASPEDIKNWIFVLEKAKLVRFIMV